MPLAHSYILPLCHSCRLLGDSCKLLSEGKWPQPGFQVILHTMQAAPESREQKHYNRSLGHPWSTRRKGILWLDRTSNNMSRPFRLEGKRSRGMSLFFVMGFGQWCGWMVKGLERTQLEWWWKGSLRKEYVERPFCAHRRKMCPLWMLPNKWLQQWWGLIVKLDSLAHAWDASQPLIHPVIAQWASWAKCHWSRDWVFASA